MCDLKSSSGEYYNPMSKEIQQPGESAAHISNLYKRSTNSAARGLLEEW